MINAFLLRYRFRLLFASSVLLTCVSGWPAPSLVLKWTAFSLLVLSAMNTLRHKGILLRIALALGIVNLSLFFLDKYIVMPGPLSDGVGLIAFYLLVVYALFNRVIHQRPVTQELLYGLLALYLQLALAFAAAFHVINSFVPDAFWSEHSPLELHDFVYYSLVTLTTVGYGDIHALAPGARLLAGAEAVTGVMFIAVAVARTLTLMSDKDPLD
ncbi:potassium channel family protein [Pseudomonas sp. RL_15y_Pfl2_60]|uniref:potassium channel family protein n=1 Tax=Pseudomonas sp. RL_15y_Pfl2_60 TaxID=3088709 RepID=UPI0030DC4372